jgi:ferrous-iron efflux pump FieF
MAVSIFLNIILLIYQKKTLSQTRSLIILCDYTHYKMDLMMHFGIVLSLGLSLFYNIVALDVAIAIGIGIYIFYSSFHIAKQSLDMLMDSELPMDTKKKIIHEIVSHEHVRGFHNLRTYQAGSTSIIQFHLELEDHLPLIDAHKISDEVEESISKMLPSSDITIHLDPFSGEFNRSHTFHDHFTKS